MPADAVPAIYADRVLCPDGTAAPFLGPARIEVADGVITRVVPQPREIFEARRAEGCLDLGDRLVTPAFVNSHTHLAMSALRGLGGDEARRGNVVEDLWFRIESQITADDVRAFTRMGALECLVVGTGAVFDHYYYGEAVAQALAEVGLEGLVAPTLQDLGGPGAGMQLQGLQTTMAIDRDAALHAAGIGAALGPHATDTVSDLLWARVVDASRRLELPIHVHVGQSLDEVQRALEAGYDSPVDRLLARGRMEGAGTVLLVHGLHTTQDDRERLRPEQVVHVHCPASQLQFAFPADLRRWQRFRVALGTDAGACNDSMNVQRELLLLAHGEGYRTTFSKPRQDRQDVNIQAGAEDLHRHRSGGLSERGPRVQPHHALESVWGIPGRAHPRLTWGRIAPGARATLAVWDLGHPALWPAREPLRALAFGDASPALHSLFVGGRVIGAVGDVRSVLHSPQVAAWRAEADARLDQLLARVG